jgi:hypothetical protein
LKISQQPENCENRNDPDLVQAFLKKWWVESDFKAPKFKCGSRKENRCDSVIIFFYCRQNIKFVVKIWEHSAVI